MLELEIDRASPAYSAHLIQRNEVDDFRTSRTVMSYEAMFGSFLSVLSIGWNKPETDRDQNCERFNTSINKGKNEAERPNSAD